MALITHPRRLIFATEAAHIVTGPAECQVRGWSSTPIKVAQARIDGDEWVEMRATDDARWKFAVPADTLCKGEHTLEARLIDENKGEGSDRITFPCDLSGRYNPYPWSSRW